LLRGAREASGMHVAALAVALKVPVVKLEALENDRYELMPDMVFVRALASSICRMLNLDPEPVLSRLPRTGAPRLVRDIDGINTPFRAPSDAAPPGWRAHLRQPVFVAVVALLLGALILMLLPDTFGDGKSVVKLAITDAGPAVAVTPMDTVQTVIVPSSVSASDASAAKTTEAAPSAAPANPVLLSTVSSPALENAATGTATSPAASIVPITATVPSTAAGGVVFVRAKSESWVEITDAKGAVAVRKVLSAGEAASAEGALPLQVTIGRVDATEVQVRGQPFDLRPVSRDNVARFVVK
jgi:cytoskeleton protein RodZ